MSEIVNCPFCGNVVDASAYRCPHCGSLFAEPQLKGLRFKDFGLFLALTILTFGLFGTLWFFINAKALNNLATNTKDRIKFNWLIVLLILNVAAYIIIICKLSLIHIASILVLLQLIIYMLLTYRVIRIIQKYTNQTYGVNIEYNPFYVVIFNLLYMIHYIDTYTGRVMQIHEYFNWKSPQMFLLVILLLIIQFMFCLNPHVHQFYRWLFRF